MKNNKFQTETIDLIWQDLRDRKVQRQAEILNLRGLQTAKNELIVASVGKHSIFIDKGEINFLLRKKLTRAHQRLEYINQKLAAVDYAPNRQEDKDHDTAQAE